MTRIAPALAVFFALASPVFADDCRIPGLPNIIGLDYHHARADLIVAGFRPVPVARSFERDGRMFDEPDAVGYFEASDCSGTGFAGCLYKWKSPTGRRFTVYAREVFGQVKARAGSPISCD